MVTWVPLVLTPTLSFQTQFPDSLSAIVWISVSQAPVVPTYMLHRPDDQSTVGGIRGRDVREGEGERDRPRTKETSQRKYKIWWVSGFSLLCVLIASVHCLGPEM